MCRFVEWAVRFVYAHNVRGILLVGGVCIRVSVSFEFLGRIQGRIGLIEHCATGGGTESATDQMAPRSIGGGLLAGLCRRVPIYGSGCFSAAPVKTCASLVNQYGKGEW